MEKLVNYLTILENLLDVADEKDVVLIQSLRKMYEMTGSFSNMQLVEIEQLMKKYNKNI